jgi:hypothetical protein
VTDDEIHVFRVDISDSTVSVEFWADDWYIFSRLKQNDDAIPAIMMAGMDWGWVWNCIAMQYWKHRHQTVRVRVYRRGFQTVEICPNWLRSPEIEWTEVHSLGDEEDALDRLLSTKATNPQCNRDRGARVWSLLVKPSSRFCDR